MALLGASLLLLAGLALGLGGSLPPLPAALGALALLALAVGARLLRSERPGAALVVAAVLCAGVWRGALARVDTNGLQWTSASFRAISCQVASDPEPNGLYQSFTCQPDGGAALLVTTPATQLLQYGDRVAFEAEVETPAAVEPGYRRALARRGVGGLAFAEEWRLLESGPSTWRRALYAFRRTAVGLLRRAIPEPEASFLSGVLIGQDAGFAESSREDMRRAGLLHLLVVSGLNVSLLAAALVGALRRMVRWPACFLALLVVGAAYALLTGAEPPVMRALVMALVAVGAHVAGRPGYAPSALALAAAGMAVWSPGLIAEPSYQLSLATTAGLVWAEGRHIRLAGRWARLSPVAAALTTTLAAQAAALPIVAANFGQVPALGLLANCLVLPAQAPLMLAALVAAVAGLVTGAVSAGLAFAAWLLARYTLLVAHYAAALPAASLNIAAWPAWATPVYYAVLVAAADALGKRYLLRGLRRGWRALKAPGSRLSPLGAGAALAVVVWAGALQLPDGRLHVAFLDVGQGDAALITTPSGRRLLVDGGRDPDLLLAHLGRALPMWQRRLDVVVATHPDMDHIGGLLGLAGRYEVGALLAPEMEVPAAWVARWSSLEEGAGRNLVAAAGLRVTVEDGLALEVLYPPAAGCPAWAEGDNDCGLVLRLSYGQATFLLTGDAEEPVERSLLIRGALASVWLLKVAHHGSAHGTSEGLLRVALPRLAVISVGDNRYGHPAPDVLERLATSGTDVFRTDQSGTVEIVTDGVTYRVNRAR